MPNWTILLVPPLLAIACLLARGLFDRHPGHRVATGPGRHFPGGRARQAEAIEIGREIAWVARVQHHGPSPLRARQLELAALTATLPGWAEPATGPIHPTAWQPLPPAAGPVPAALEDTPAADDLWQGWGGDFADWERDSIVMPKIKAGQ